MAIAGYAHREPAVRPRLGWSFDVSQRKHLPEIGRECPPSFNRVEIVGLAAWVIERSVRRPEESDVRMRDRRPGFVHHASINVPHLARMPLARDEQDQSRRKGESRDLESAPVTGLYGLHDGLQAK